MDAMTAGVLSEEEIQAFRRLLLAWFQANARDLPWRRTRDPYSIWISEVMLQQTRVSTVIDRYRQFMRRFPSLVSLALAREEEVLALWSGLGYYKRARMLHGAAQLLVNEHGGSLPKTSAELRRLPGVGEYTAAAIASIAHGEPSAVVDGNVERVMMRVLGSSVGSRRLSATRLKEDAGLLLDASAPGTFNQAMMELGAVVCLPRVPLCPSCPVQEICRTRGDHGARPRKQMISRKVDYALVRRNRPGSTNRMEVLLVRRPTDAAQMPGMWELPLLSALGQNAKPEGEPILRLRHSITSSNYYVGVYNFSAENAAIFKQFEGADSGKDREWVPDHGISEIPLTGLARKILMRLDVLARPTQVRQGKALPGIDAQYF